MTDATIPLAKGRDDAKRNYPGYLSVKLDGVPVRIDVTIKDGRIQSHTVRSRQGKPVPSVEPVLTTLLNYMRTLYRKDTIGQNLVLTLVAEVTHETLTDFKDVSGVVRKQSPQEGLVLNLFDMDTGHSVPFRQRQAALLGIFICFDLPGIKIVPQVCCSDPLAAASAEHTLLGANPNCEGLIWRDGDAVWAPGTRRWDYQKILNEPTVDLFITGFEEAVCGKTGAGKGMVGGLLANYKGTEIGIGPGKLTHKERTEMFRGTTPSGQRLVAKDANGKFRWLAGGEQCRFLAQIKHKRDPSYDALRQPTWQHWRLDKDGESYE